MMSRKFSKKNRYSDIFPMRMTMATTDGKVFNEQNYLNANYVLGPRGEVDFIGCQGPLENTFDDFWNMIRVNSVELIIGKWGW